MSKIWLPLVALITLIALGTSFVPSAASADPTSTPCTRKVFKTVLIKQACAKGGQAAARAAMKTFARSQGISQCRDCHAQLAPSYKLKDAGLRRFQELGGK